MRRLIKIDDVLELIEDAQDGSKGTYDILADVFNRVLALPSADAVEVVRCKDCKHQEECEQIVVFDIHVDSVQGHRVDFCSYGERKGGDED